MAGQRFSGFLALLVIANLPLSTGFPEGFAGYGAAFNGRIGPWDANSTAFLEAVAASNATAVYKIPGYDRSAPSVGHSLAIEAPQALLKSNTDGTKIVDTDPSWGMCLWDFGGPNQLQKERYNNPDNKPLAADGSCKGFLSDACIAALEKATEYAYSPAEHAGRVRGDLQEYWDSQVLNYWVLVTAMVNSTIDPDTPSWRRGEILSSVHCVAPNGAGTGKGFTFSGVVPANALNSDGEEDGDGNDAGVGNGGNGGDGDSGAGLTRDM
ncbi:hypothetical protein B0I37DRAFT_431312 [Chaetomium sp. MPI-CAGE-AT-0009]|nr:hypothetical protein B0I37DRAFT_431312 [Chaetomium sp. MPI-CAGE-AT-0009]